jgi:hypothetical protein
MKAKWNGAVEFFTVDDRIAIATIKLESASSPSGQQKLGA